MKRLIEITTHLFRFLIHKVFYNYYYFGNVIAIDSGVEISAAKYISIADHVHLQKDVWINIVKKPSQNKPVVMIGKYSDIGKRAFISAIESVVIEDYVLIAPNVYVSDHSHQYFNIKKPIMSQQYSEIKPVRLKTGCWIGMNVVILPGVTIGKNSVIGANSVVTKSIPDYTVAIGSPAKVIKKFDLKNKRWIKVN